MKMVASSSEEILDKHGKDEKKMRMAETWAIIPVSFSFD